MKAESICEFAERLSNSVLNDERAILQAARLEGLTVDEFLLLWRAVRAARGDRQLIRFFLREREELQKR